MFYITKLKNAARDTSTRLEATEMVDAELKIGEALGEALALAYGYPLEVIQVAEAGAGTGTLPVFTGEALLGPAGTKPTVGTESTPVAVFVTKLTWGTVTV